ncbi:Oidioi.mRNA.OKI2018_I69.PAR.g9063.t1.cds [Oikopleura dioica]|uniref:Oidioi.mRNA.OKI2018_I69.PAR.g9063.t1.cds n=1 Tax=Oikopleura dioica TaxID=34765 RepID=A0ABN7RMV5_OIKDI|nr:Oidioi.mRNA.OKI2018_I69.PAR.g9063.t1.cds [Oikopleura dioica]
MKFSTSLFFFGFAAAQEEEGRKVPPRHPLQRLNRLTQFSEEILTQWFSGLASQERWIAKFATNAGRMEKNFLRGEQRCGFYDPSLPHGGPEPEEEDELRYDRTDPRIGIKQITTGYRKWAQRYMAACSGQKNYQYQVNRMNRWNSILQDHLNRIYPQA